MPIVAAVTFGSFGDIVTIVQLVSQLRDALNDVTGAPAEIEALSADFTGYMLVLTLVEGILLSRDSHFDPRTRVAIEGGLKRCKDTLLAIQRHVERVQPRVGRHIFLAYAAAVRWRLFGARREVANLHARLEKQLLFVQICLGVSQSHALHDVAERNRVATEQILLLVNALPPHINAGASLLQLYDWKTKTAYEAFEVVPLRMFPAYLDPLIDFTSTVISSLRISNPSSQISYGREQILTFVESMRPGLTYDGDLELKDTGSYESTAGTLFQCTVFSSGCGEPHALIGVPPFLWRDSTLQLLSGVLQGGQNERRHTREAHRQDLLDKYGLLTAMADDDWSIAARTTRETPDHDVPGAIFVIWNSKDPLFGGHRERLSSSCDEWIDGPPHGWFKTPCVRSVDANGHQTYLRYFVPDQALELSAGVLLTDPEGDSAPAPGRRVLYPRQTCF